MRRRAGDTIVDYRLGEAAQAYVARALQPASFRTDWTMQAYAGAQATPTTRVERRRCCARRPIAVLARVGCAHHASLFHKLLYLGNL